MLRWIHIFIVCAYLAAPVVGMGWLLIRRRVTTARRGTRLFATISIAIVLGSAVALSCALAAGGRVSAGQIGLCVYLTASLLILISTLDHILIEVLRKA